MSEAPGGPNVTVLHPAALEVALGLAGGDVRRLRIMNATTVYVVNRPGAELPGPVSAEPAALTDDPRILRAALRALDASTSSILRDLAAERRARHFGRAGHSRAARRAALDESQAALDDRPRRRTCARCEAHPPVPGLPYCEQCAGWPADTRLTRTTRVRGVTSAVLPSLGKRR